MKPKYVYLNLNVFWGTGNSTYKGREFQLSRCVGRPGLQIVAENGEIRWRLYRLG